MAQEVPTREMLNFQPVEWPLRFKEHFFNGLCYSTLKCTIWYSGLDHGDRDPSPPSSDIGPRYLDHLSGGYSVRNFPAPAEVEWRSKDGTDHKAEIDIGDIFRDELLRHHVRREEVDEQPDGKLGFDPSIFLEVNDRTIRVHMRPWIPLKKPIEIAGRNPNYIYDDLILVKTYNY